MEKRTYLSIFLAICVLMSALFFALLSFSDKTNTTKDENGTLRFLIRNYDTVNHTVTVEILDLNNSSRFNKSYDIAPDERLKPISVSLKKDTYLYEITLDNNITKTEVTGKNPNDLSWEFLIIRLNPYPEEPLELGIAIE
ncbi:hypothetical protein [Methanolobus sp. WCC4]|uniref:hypothetical protein n=1 Tax=Methanolobus sp. WCC4 TaxID=3125784 RepID=UPI0030FAEA9F